MNKRLIYGVLLICIVTSGNSLWGFGKKTFLGGRSQSVDLPGEIVGWQQLVNRESDGCSYIVHSIMAKYYRSTHADNMSHILFGDTPLVFSGSRVVNRGETDILADYFGLPSNFKSSVCFSPVITNFMMDFNWYHGLDGVLPGLYYRIHMPIVHSKWDLNLHEKIVNPGTPFNGAELAVAGSNARPAAYPAGYLGQNRISSSQASPSVEVALQGKAVFGDMGDPLQFGKIFGRQEVTRASDIQFALGWNFLLSDWYHVGCALRIVAPVGNPSEAEFLFEPIVGNGAHWEVGLGFTSHAGLWQSCDERRAVAVYFDANITHLCASKQKRSFDFIANGEGSRYMLLTDNGSPSDNLFFNAQGDDDGVAAETQYQYRLVSAINKTTFDTHVSIGVQADIVLKCAYQHGNTEFDLGYNFWACSKEKGRRCQMLESNRFGIKGDAQLYGFTAGVPGSVATPLNVTQHQATLHAGQGASNVLRGPLSYTNSNADTPQPVFGSDVGFVQLNNADSVALSVAQTPINGSVEPVFLKDADIDMRSGLATKAFTHKIFAHINHAWRGYEEYTPYIGVGGMTEWAGSCPDKNSGHNQWGVWLKGGIAY